MRWTGRERLKRKTIRPRIEDVNPQWSIDVLIESVQPSSMTFEEASILFDYDPETGDLRNKINRGKRALSGRKAGSVAKDGYVRVMVRGKSYMAHRIAWLVSKGRCEGILDHVNRIRSDNRLCNLRQVDNFANRHNSSINRNNRSGAKGVTWDVVKQKWKARVMVFGKRISAGYFDSLQEAESAVSLARVKAHGEFTCHR